MDEVKLKYLPKEIVRSSSDVLSLSANYNCLLRRFNKLSALFFELYDDHSDKILEHEMLIAKHNDAVRKLKELMSENIFLKLSPESIHNHKEYEFSVIKASLSSLIDKYHGKRLLMDNLREQVFDILKSIQKNEASLNMTGYEKFCKLWSTGFLTPLRPKTTLFRCVCPNACKCDFIGEQCSPSQNKHPLDSKKFQLEENCKTKLREMEKTNENAFENCTNGSKRIILKNVSDKNLNHKFCNGYNQFKSDNKELIEFPKVDINDNYLRNMQKDDQSAENFKPGLPSSDSPQSCCQPPVNYNQAPYSFVKECQYKKNISAGSSVFLQMDVNGQRLNDHIENLGSVAVKNSFANQENEFGKSNRKPYLDPRSSSDSIDEVSRIWFSKHPHLDYQFQGWNQGIRLNESFIIDGISELSKNVSLIKSLTQIFPAVPIQMLKDSICRVQVENREFLHQIPFYEIVQEILNYTVFSLQETKDCCPICLQGFGKLDHTTLDCRHSFHKVCLYGWMGFSNCCPICKRFI